MTLSASQSEGIAAGWKSVRPGERLVVLAYQVDDAVAQIMRYAAADDACAWPVASLSQIPEAA